MIIAEIGQAHDGSLGILHSYIDAIAATGVDAIKFQTHIAEAESSAYEQFRIPFSYVDKSRFDYWKRMELTLEQWQQVSDHCRQAGVQFISSPFSCEAVNLLEQVGIAQYKIGSGEITNHLLLQKIADTQKPVILSSGMSNMQELEDALSIFTPHNAPVSILQCTTAYPTMPAQWGLHILKVFKDRFNIPVGFSDHSGDIFACLAATAMGAEILEVHAVFDKRMFGPDAKASIEIDELARLVTGVKQIRESLTLAYSKNEASKGFDDLKRLFGKSLAVNRDLPEGHVLSFADLEAKKPGNKGIAAREYKRLIGAGLKKPLQQWDFINENDIHFS